jgi:hypothetical protein
MTTYQRSDDGAISTGTSIQQHKTMTAEDIRTLNSAQARSPGHPRHHPGRQDPDDPPLRRPRRRAARPSETEARALLAELAQQIPASEAKERV